MSLIMLIGFLMMYAGKLPSSDLTYEYLAIWALFAIADALWIRGWGNK